MAEPATKGEWKCKGTRAIDSRRLRGERFYLGRARLRWRRAGNARNADRLNRGRQRLRGRVSQDTMRNLQLRLRSGRRNCGVGDMAHLTGAVCFVMIVAVGMAESIDAQYAYRQDQRYRQQPQKKGSGAHSKATNQAYSRL